MVTPWNTKAQISLEQFLPIYRAPRLAISLLLDIIIANAPVAQWIEQETSKLLAASSILARGTILLMFKETSSEVSFLLK